MIRIGICDDEKAYREQMKEICEGFFQDLEIECLLYTSGDSFLQSKDEPDILFLDIEMPEMDGISLKNYLGEIRSGIKIVFMTSHSERMREAFGQNVIDFVIKPFRKAEIEDILCRLTKFLDQRSVDIKVDGDNISIPLSEILYIEAYDKYTRVQTESARYLVRMTMNEWEDLLESPDFCRCSRFNLINMKYYDQKRKKAVFGNREISIGRSFRGKVAEVYLEYLRKAAVGY